MSSYKLHSPVAKYEPVTFVTNETRLSRILSVPLKRETALELWKRRILGTATVPNLEFKLKREALYSHMYT